MALRQAQRDLRPIGDAWTAYLKDNRDGGGTGGGDGFGVDGNVRAEAMEAAAAGCAEQHGGEQKRED